jgi:pimeloyl-ACP methyl ester carboxylesterase
MPFAENRGVRIHWEERGSGTPVVLVMGHRYSSAMWYPILPALAAEHRVITFDNRGTGESDMTRQATLGDFVDDTLAVMDAAGVQKAHIFGVSMGGGIVMELAVRHSERVISLIPGCTAMMTADKPRMPAFMRALYYLPPGLLKLLFASRRGGAANDGYGSAADPKDVAFDQAMIAKDKTTVAGSVAQARAIANYVVTREALAALRMPTLVPHGDEDALVPFASGEEIAATIPGARLVRLEGAGHNFLVAAPEKSRTAVLEFLREVDRNASRAGTSFAQG